MAPNPAYPGTWAPRNAFHPKMRHATKRWRTASSGEALAAGRARPAPEGRRPVAIVDGLVEVLHPSPGHPPRKRASMPQIVQDKGQTSRVKTQGPKPRHCHRRTTAASVGRGAAPSQQRRLCGGHLMRLPVSRGLWQVRAGGFAHIALGPTQLLGAARSRLQSRPPPPSLAPGPVTHHCKGDAHKVMAGTGNVRQCCTRLRHA